MSVALIVSAGAALALPTCKWSGTEMSTLLTWHNCYGELARTGVVYKGEWQNNKWHGKGSWSTGYSGDKRSYVGEFKNGLFHGKGTITYSNGTKVSGTFKNSKLVSVEKTNEKSLLNKAFYNLSFKKRKQVQSILSDLGFYKSSIDGLYGKGTAAALTAYNKQNLTAADLTKSNNVNKLMTAVLALKSSPTPKPKVIQTDNPDNTYKVASGTGFYVSSQGHIITNHHVIDGCKDMKVHSKGKVLETIKIADDARNDLALLKIAETPAMCLP